LLRPTPSSEGGRAKGRHQVRQGLSQQGGDWAGLDTTARFDLRLLQAFRTGVHGLEERESTSGRPQRRVFRAGVVQRIFPLLHSGSGNKAAEIRAGAGALEPGPPAHMPLNPPPTYGRDPDARGRPGIWPTHRQTFGHPAAAATGGGQRGPDRQLQQQQQQQQASQTAAQVWRQQDRLCALAVNDQPAEPRGQGASCEQGLGPAQVFAHGQFYQHFQSRAQDMKLCVKYTRVFCYDHVLCTYTSTIM